jgi:3-phenylpropionate/cinnamic acid dioxygenase small subunit
MDEDRVLAIEWQCAKVLTHYYNLVDQGDFDTAVKLFTPDVVWSMGGDEYSGREGNLSGMRKLLDESLIRHVISNIVVSVIDEDHAEAVTYLVVYCYPKQDVADGKLQTVAANRFSEVVNKMVRTEEGWRISRREIKNVMATADESSRLREEPEESISS